MIELKIGDIVYILNKNSVKVSAALVNKQIITNTVSGTNVSYSLMLEDTSTLGYTDAGFSDPQVGTLFKDLAAVREHLVSRAVATIDKVIMNAHEDALRAFGESRVDGCQNEPNPPVQESQDPQAEKTPRKKKTQPTVEPSQ
jgi:hypothetical protein